MVTRMTSESTQVSETKDTSAVGYATNALRQGIKDNLFAPGQRLVINDICQHLGISAGPVREAIRRLTGEGLVVFEPNKGASVRRFDAADIEEIFEVRIAIESRAAELAAQRIGNGDNRARLTALIGDGAAAVETGGAVYIDHNARLHRLIYEIAGNRRLAEIAEGLTLPLYRMQLHALMERPAAEISHREHLEIVDAILAGKADDARLAMRRHVAQSGVAMADSVQRRSSPTRPGARRRRAP